MADTNTNPSDLSRTLRTRLAAGIVDFTFVKIDGSTRPATGTTVMALIPPAFRPPNSTTARRSPDDLITYFDLGVMAWRSCKTNNVQSIDN
jgi:hypothetical protein